MNNKHSLPAYLVVPRLYLIVIATFIAAVSSTVTAAVTHNDVQQALKMLDRELSHRETYTNRREAGIDSLRQQRYGVSPRSKEWFDATMRIARGYSSFNNDSTRLSRNSGCSVHPISPFQDTSTSPSTNLNRLTHSL